MVDKGLTPVKKGDPLEIRHETWNAMLAAARRGQANQNNLATPPPVENDRDTVWVQNDSGGDLSRYAVLGVSGIIFTPGDEGFDDSIALTGVSPVAGTHEGKFVVLIDAIPSSEIGRAVLIGATVCQVAVTDTDHEYAEIANGVTATLASASTGSAQIIWAEAGTGTKWAIVRLGNELTPSASADKTPAGAVIETASTSATAPDGWLFCDGGSYTTAGQPALFAEIGYTYGGSGANFNVPDMGGRVRRGFIDSDPLGLFDTVGVDAGIEILDLMHNHSFGSGTSVPTGPSAFFAVPFSSGTSNTIAWNGARDAPVVDRPDDSFDGYPLYGGDNRVDNRGPYIVMRSIIKT